MSCLLCIEFRGAEYHVNARGDSREPIFVDDEDWRSMLAVVEQATARFDVQLLAYCLIGSQYYLVLHTRQANLSRLMRHLNGVTTQVFNRRHGKVRHLFQRAWGSRQSCPGITNARHSVPERTDA